MTAVAKRLADEAMSLPWEERAALIETLLSSLNAPTAADVDQAWAAEIERRLRDVDEGRVTSLPGDQVFAELRAKYAR